MDPVSWHLGLCTCCVVYGLAWQLIISWAVVVQCLRFFGLDQQDIFVFIMHWCFLFLCLAGTPYEGGVFRMKLVLSQDFPQTPPKGDKTYLFLPSTIISIPYLLFLHHWIKDRLFCAGSCSFVLDCPINVLCSMPYITITSCTCLELDRMEVCIYFSPLWKPSAGCIFPLLICIVSSSIY